MDNCPENSERLCVSPGFLEAQQDRIDQLKRRVEELESLVALCTPPRLGFDENLMPAPQLVTHVANAMANCMALLRRAGWGATLLIDMGGIPGIAMTSRTVGECIHIREDVPFILGPYYKFNV